MYEKILVPLDGSATSERALKEAAQLAGKLGSTLCLLHVLDEHAHPAVAEKPQGQGG